MTFYRFDLSSSQEIIQVWNATSNVPYAFLSIAFKTALLGYIVILGPMLEEYLFRDRLYEFMKNLTGEPNSVLSIVFRVVGNGFIFGLVHLSPFQGWTNVPIFVVTFAMGCIFAALREQRETPQLRQLHIFSITAQRCFSFAKFRVLNCSYVYRMVP